MLKGRICKMNQKKEPYVGSFNYFINLELQKIINFFIGINNGLLTNLFWF